MRSLQLLLVVCLFALAVGCAYLKDRAGITEQHKGAGPVPKVTSEQLVGYLNMQAGKLQTIAYGDTRVTAKEGDGIKGAIREMTYPTLTGNLSASQPRNFRMVVTSQGVADVRVDLGSNTDQFWVYFGVPTVPKTFVFASHSDFENGKAKLPGGMPFDPDWVLQALGMTTFPPPSPTMQYTVKTDEVARTHTLSWPATAPNGMAIHKEIVFAADDADSGHEEPQVRRHLIRDAKGKVVCSAEVKGAKTIPVGGTDPQTKRPYIIQYPTVVVLRWEEQKFEMTMKLSGARVNQQMTAEETRRLFTIPNIPGVSPVNLVEGRFSSP